MEKTDREILAERFSRLYPKRRLLAVQLNGFSHSLFMDYGKRSDDVIVHRVTCAPEQRGSHTNTDKAKTFFMGYPNYVYQNNAQEIVFVNPEDR